MKTKFKVLSDLLKRPGIYKISCTKTNKVYIGESINVLNRVRKHLSLLKHDKHSNPILQNMFNKYGEDTFKIEVLEYVNTTNKYDLHMLEYQYQLLYDNCISYDCNSDFHIQRSSKWKLRQKDLLNTARKKSNNTCKIPILIYNIQTKELLEFSSIKEAKLLMGIKHIYKNIRDKILIPYKNYVAFLKNEFNSNLILQIITQDPNLLFGSNRGIYIINNLLTDEIKYFSSKRQLLKYYSDSKNTSVYDKLNKFNVIDFNFNCSEIIKTKKLLLNKNIYIGSNSFKYVSLNTWFKALNENKTYIKMSDMLGINRKLISSYLQERSKEDWIEKIKFVLSKLPE